MSVEHLVRDLPLLGAGAEQKTGKDGHCVPESEMLVILDRNMEVPWKGGNKYSRVCPECGYRTFCPASRWEALNDDPTRVAWVVERGEEVPRPLYFCPWTEQYVGEDEDPCGEEFAGSPRGEAPPDECPHCERGLEFADPQPEEIEE